MPEGLCGPPGPSWGPRRACRTLGPLLTAPVGVPVGLLAAAVPRPEWQASERRQRQRAQARQRRRAAKRADREGADPRSPALAVSLGGDLASWRIGDLIVPPAGQLGLAWLLIGAPGVGKSTAQTRLAYLAGRERRHLVVIDAKGGHDGLAREVVAAYLAGWPGARVRSFPQERLDIWRGEPQAIVNRLVEVWDWTAESAYYREVAMTALRLAVAQPGPPIGSGADLMARLDPRTLTRAWEHDDLIRGLVQDLAKGNDLAGVHVRIGNLVAALAGRLDGSASWEDADCWVVTVPAMVASRDADAALRVLLADYAHFTMARKRPGQPSLLMVDEFAAIAGGRRVAIDLLERGRGAASGVALSGQSAASLGTEEERARLFAAANAALMFRTPQPAELAGLAGSERVAEAAWQVEAGELTGRATITERHRARVDQDQARQLPVGEAELIVAGWRERIRIIPTTAPAVDAARQLLAGKDRPLPAAAAPGNPAPGRGPADAVAGRRVPGPVPPRQGSAPTAPPDGALDPPGPGRVRRHRPPGAGGSGPASDRGSPEKA
jgi:hypothetical protein